MLEKTDEFSLRSSTDLKQIDGAQVLKGNSSPTRLLKVLLLVTGATANLVL